MARLKVVSIVEDTWGSAVVYDEEKEPNKQNILDSTPLEIRLVSKTSVQKLDEDIDRRYVTKENVLDHDELTYLQSSLSATVLEDTILDLKILAECNNELRVAKTHVDMSLLLSLKFEIAQPENKDELESIDPNFLGCNDYKLNKLEEDRKYFKDAIATIYKELSLCKTFETLKSYVNNIVNEDNYRIVLAEDETKNKILRRDLNKQLRQQRNHIKSVIYDTDATIDDLQSQVEDASLNAEIRSRYVENWQRSRTEQHLQSIEDKEADPSSVIEYYKRRTDHEQRVHSEVELLTNIIINETLEKIESWMLKYDKDMENLDLKIQIKKNDYQNQLDKRIELECTIEKHDIMMKEWIQFKDEREKARQYHKKMTESAIIVQAWWRGLLVRRQLGPFKVAKKKGGAAGKKK